MIYSIDIFVGYIVSEILVKSQRLLTLIIHGTEAPLYTKKKISRSVYPLYGSNRLAVDNKILYVHRHF